ncbi:MAG: ATP-grasp domain-containing protein [Alphaproteobacteria bacterium]|nr:ATP-grasp domain-containing protein [Alphaproteobacteria bacterium]
MIKLLLLSCGTNACYHCAKTLKEKFQKDFYIVGADINEQYLTPTCNYLDAFYKVPYSTSPDYYETIIKILNAEKVDYILPSFDSDQKLFYPENEDLIKLNVKSFAVSLETLKIYDNKEKMNSFLNSNGFLTPKFFNQDEIENNKDYFVKPKNGVGSIGAKIETGFNIKNLDYANNILIQEICSEPEYTVECFNFNGVVHTITRERIASKAGVCTKTKIFNYPELEKITKDFAKKVKCPHCFNLQFMKNQNDEFVITDVNLRLAGGMSLSAIAGWDEISALAKIMLDKKEEEIFETLPEKIQPQYIVRAYTDIVTKIEKQIVAFDFDGTLLDSRKRHSVLLNDILNEYNIKLDTSDLIEFKRNNKNNVDYLISKGINENLAKEIQTKWIDNIEKEEYLALDVLYPETIELLEKYSNEYDLILITARNNKVGLQKQIDKFDLRKYFKEIYVVNSGKNTIEDKAEVLNKKNVVEFIGDTLSDKKAAEIAKIEFKHFNDGFHSKTILED